MKSPTLIVSQKYENLDRAAYERAMVEVRGSPDLRRLLTFLYRVTGMALNPFTTNALTTAHNTGKMAAGIEFFGLLNEIDPQFLPGLLQEMNNDQLARNTDFALAQRDERR